jgi:predicted RND superfamily exporter protein
LAGRLRQEPEIRQAIERFDILFMLKQGYLLVPRERLSQFASALQSYVGVNAATEPADWDEALRRVQSWLDGPPSLSGADIDLETAEESLLVPLFFLEQWHRFLESQKVPESIPWHELAPRQGARILAERGYFSSRDGKTLFLFVRPSSSSEEFEILQPFIEKVRKTAEDLRKEYTSAGSQAPEVGLTGLPAVSCEEYTALRRDIVLVVCSAGVLVLLLIFLWLRSIKWALLVFVPMGLGVLFSTALAYVFVGHLTLLTSGFTAILFGLGVDYGIFMSSRIIEELADSRRLTEAISKGVASSAKALVTAGMAAVLIFAVLTTVPFTGFAELGVVAGMGVFMVLLSTFLIQPALFAIFPPSPELARRYQRIPETAHKPARTKLLRYGHVYLLVVAVLTAGVGAVWSTKIPFDYDVLSLLPRNSEAAYYQRKMVEESDFQAETVIFTASTMEEARKLTAEAGKLPSVARVESLTYLFPSDVMARAEQARRIGRMVSESEYLKQILELGKAGLTQESMQQIDSSLEKAERLIEDSADMALSAGHKQLVGILEKILSSLETLREELKEDPEKARERTQSYVQSVLADAKGGFSVLETWTDANGLTPKDLPGLLRQRFFAEDGTIAIYAFPAESVYDPENLNKLIQEIYSVSKNATGFPTTHQVFSEMIVDSLHWSSRLAAAVASIWILLMLRSIRGFLIAIFPLLIGGGWMMGILYLVRIKFNYANIIALPLMIGLAVDYGVWFGHRRHELKNLSPWRVARQAGRAITLAAGTTVAGLGAITLAQYRGLSSLGLSITIGLCCCLVAALVLSPALAQLLFRRENRER